MHGSSHLAQARQQYQATLHNLGLQSPTNHRNIVRRLREDILPPEFLKECRYICLLRELVMLSLLHPRHT